MKQHRMLASVNQSFVHPFNDYLEAIDKNLHITKTQDGIFVNCCRLYSVPWSLGLRSGDVIIGKNGKITSDIRSEDVLEFCKAGDDYNLYVYRQGDTLTLNNRKAR